MIQKREKIPLFYQMMSSCLLLFCVLFFPSRRAQHLPCLWCFIITAVSAGKIRKASWFWAEEETVFHSELIWMTGQCVLTFLCFDRQYLQSYWAPWVVCCKEHDHVITSTTSTSFLEKARTLLTVTVYEIYQPLFLERACAPPSKVDITLFTWIA